MQELSIVSMVVIFCLSLLVILMDHPRQRRGMPDDETNIDAEQLHKMMKARYNRLVIDLQRIDMQISAHGYEENAPLAMLRQRDRMQDEKRILLSVLDSYPTESS